MKFDKIKELITLNKGIYKGEILDSIIIESEKELNIKYPEEYREFLKTYGYLVIGSNEIFGLGIQGHLNVVNNTLDEIKNNENLNNFIVIQNEGIGYLILLNSKGEIFEYSNDIFTKIYDSFYDYLLTEILI